MQTRSYSMTAHNGLRDIMINHVLETGNYNRWMLDQFCEVTEVPVDEYCNHSVGKRFQYLDPEELVAKYGRFDRVATPMRFDDITKSIEAEIVGHYIGQVPILAVYLDADQIVRIYSSATKVGSVFTWMQSKRFHRYNSDRKKPLYDWIAKQTPVAEVLCDGKIVLYKVLAKDLFLAVDAFYREVAEHKVNEQLALREAVAKLIVDGKSLEDYSEPELLSALTANIVEGYEHRGWREAISEDLVKTQLKMVSWTKDEALGLIVEAKTLRDGCMVVLANEESKEERVNKILLGKARHLAHHLLTDSQAELTLVATNF